MAIPAKPRDSSRFPSSAARLYRALMDDIQALVEEGVEHLDAGDFKRAAKIGKKLVALQDVCGYELLAQAHWGVGEQKEAFAAIDDGLKLLPAAWWLWHLRGAYCDEANDFAGAYGGYDHALRNPKADRSSVHLTYAITLSRDGRPEEALRHLEQVTTDETIFPASSVRAEALETLGRREEAVEMLRNMFTLECDNNVLLAQVHADLASLHLSGNDRNSALQESWIAVALDRGNEDAQELIRELEGDWLAPAVLYEVTLRGHWHEPIYDDGPMDAGERVFEDLD